MAVTIPVIDIFSGPGGLSEGFSRFGERPWAEDLSDEVIPRAWKDPKGVNFKIGLSIEKDPVAHRTLRLRAFVRQFKPDTLPAEYYQVLRGKLSVEALFEKYPGQAHAANDEAWCQTLGEDAEGVDARISKALGEASAWCLIGGPPCQAYSLAGRSRNKGIDGYRPEDDHRHFLYREYLRIVAVHAPTVFVMENVKGLLSSEVNGGKIFGRIIDDLANAGRFGPPKNKKLTYNIVPFVVDTEEKYPEGDGRRFILRAEELGVPQARHRVILFGIRSDSGLVLRSIPQLSRRTVVAAKQVLDGLPELRSAISGRSKSSDTWESCIERIRSEAWLSSLRRSSPELAVRVVAAVNLMLGKEGERGGQFVPGAAPPKYMKSWFVDDNLVGVCNHEARSHMAMDLHRYLFASCFALSNGRSPVLGDFPRELLPKHKNAKDAARDGALFSDRFRVQLGTRPSTTITSHISKDGHYYIHPDPYQCRALTVREAARIQTFPDNYFFCGTRTEQYHQVGNAVPPLLAVQLASAVANVFKQLGP